MEVRDCGTVVSINDGPRLEVLAEQPDKANRAIPVATMRIRGVLI